MSRKRTTIKRAYIRHYSDNKQTVAYIDWSDGKAPTRQTGRMNLELVRKAIMAEVQDQRPIKMYIVGDYILIDSPTAMTIFKPRTDQNGVTNSVILSSDGADLFRAAIAMNGSDRPPNNELVPVVERLLHGGSK